MGSKKKWTSALGGGLGLLTGDIVTAAIGAAVGHSMDKKDKKKSDGGVATSATQTEEEKAANEKNSAEGGESPFATGALATRKKRSTLVSGGTVGALSGAGGGSSMLGE